VFGFEVPLHEIALQIAGEIKDGLVFHLPTQTAQTRFWVNGQMMQNLTNISPGIVLVTAFLFCFSKRALTWQQ
jgi:hypothetical protein